MNNLDAIMQEQWTPNLQDQLRENFIFKEISNTKFDAGYFTGSDTVHFPRQAKITLGTLTSFNDAIAEQDIITSDEIFQLDTIKYFAFSLKIDDDVEAYKDPKAQAYVDAREGFSDAYDSAIAGEYTNAGYVVDDGDMEVASNGGVGNPIAGSKDNIYDLITALDEVCNTNSLPMNNRFAIFSFAEKRLLDKSPFLTRDTVAGDQIIKMGFGRAFHGVIDNMKIGFSNNLVVESGQKHAMAGQGKPVCFASNIKPMILVSDVKNNLTHFKYQVKGATKFGVKTFIEGKERLIDVRIKA